jgi:hypothetical protein
MKRFHFDWGRPVSDWREGASNLAEWQAWDRSWRRKLGWRAGLTFWSKTNVPGSRSLLARHWPHRLCWSWSIWVGVARPDFDGPNRIYLNVSRRYRSIEWRLWRFKGSTHWQDSDWMVALGPYKDDAPKIYWKHHLEHAEAVGSA